MQKRNETQANNFGRIFRLGEKFTIHKRFGKIGGENCAISEISPSGLFFKVNKSDKLFSIKTLHSKGSTLTNGFYLIPQ